MRRLLPSVFPPFALLAPQDSSFARDPFAVLAPQASSFAGWGLSQGMMSLFEMKRTVLFKFLEDEGEFLVEQCFIDVKASQSTDLSAELQVGG